MKHADTMHTLIVEDDASFASWLEVSIRQHFDSAHCVRVPSVSGAIAALAVRPPDLAIVDLHLEDGSGTDVVQAITQSAPTTAILVVTAVEDGVEAMQAIRAGAHGYVVKSRSDWSLIETVREVLAGGSPITPTIARRVLQELTARATDGMGIPPSNAPATRETPIAGRRALPQAAQQLSPREAEILRLAARGYRNKEIAVKLDLSTNTIATHVKSVYRKLSVSSRTHLRNFVDDIESPADR